ncbi:response regulator transcription factor [Brevibacterium sp. FAM 24638]|uniref:response regulator transcription factor n=1 Tax=Brevibacterium sp. FAM 24638 TaxID=3415681 RepID=UPI003C7EB9C7
MDLLARGLSVAEIAAELNQVTGTVKNRLSALYRKFGVTNRAGVLRRARSSGFLADSQSEETHT